MIAPRDFSGLLGRLVGISDHLLAQHLDLYRGEVAKLAAIEAILPTRWDPPGAEEPGPKLDAILDAPVASLSLEPIGPLAEALDAVRGDLIARGIPFAPSFYLGDGDFWTTDRATSINVPWFLANPTLWRLANMNRATAYSPDQVMRCLRHEVGHALGYAHELWRDPEWAHIFGDFNAPYREGFAADARSDDFVEYLSGAPAHYAQKHPDEDWAETFATWLDPASSWRERYAERPTILAKLEYVENLAVLRGPASNSYRGRPEPYQRVPGTVRQALGAGRDPNEGPGADDWRARVEALRLAPYVRNDVVLHELYFEQLGGDGRIVPPGAVGVYREALAGWGSWEAFQLDLRVGAGHVGNGWAVVVWDPRFARMRLALVEGSGHGVPAGCPVLLAVDAHEHAFVGDYGASGRHLGIAAFLRNLDWAVVGRRLDAALGFRLAPGGAFLGGGGPYPVPAPNAQPALAEAS